MGQTKFKNVLTPLFFVDMCLMNNEIFATEYSLQKDKTSLYILYTDRLMRRNNEKTSGFRLWMADMQMKQVAWKSEHWHPLLRPCNSIILTAHWSTSSKSMSPLNVHTVTGKRRWKAHLQRDKRHNYALHSAASTGTSGGYEQLTWYVLFALH